MNFFLSFFLSDNTYLKVFDFNWLNLVDILCFQSIFKKVSSQLVKHLKKYRKWLRSFSLLCCKKIVVRNIVSSDFCVTDFWSTITPWQGHRILCVHMILSYDSRGYHSRPRSTAMSRHFSSQRAGSRCTITVFPRILITRRMRREKPSRASRKYAEVDESRLNPFIRGGLLLRLTLSLLLLANVAAIFKRS